MIFRYVLVLFCLTLSLASCGGSSSTAQVSSAEPFPEYSDDQAGFVADNAVRESVVITESGLQYEVLSASDGVKPTANSYVSVHYAGTLTDGTEFDSSYKRGEPATFLLNRTIAGWVEGLQLMSVGSTFRFVIPPHLAYGSVGAGALIGPDETLIFIVELLEINAN